MVQTQSMSRPTDGYAPKWVRVIIAGCLVSLTVISPIIRKNPAFTNNQKESISLIHKKKGKMKILGSTTVHQILTTYQIEYEGELYCYHVWRTPDGAFVDSKLENGNGDTVFDEDLEEEFDNIVTIDFQNKNS
jgi:hypothetical protein